MAPKVVAWGLQASNQSGSDMLCLHLRRHNSYICLSRWYGPNRKHNGEPNHRQSKTHLSSVMGRIFELFLGFLMMRYWKRFRKSRLLLYSIQLHCFFWNFLSVYIWSSLLFWPKNLENNSASPEEPSTWRCPLDSQSFAKILGYLLLLLFSFLLSTEFPSSCGVAIVFVVCSAVKRGMVFPLPYFTSQLPSPLMLRISESSKIAVSLFAILIGFVWFSRLCHIAK